MARFVNAQVPEVVQPFWAALQAWEVIADAAAAAGTYRKQDTRWVVACGGVRPRRGRSLKGRCLSFAERGGIALGRERDETIRAISGGQRLHPRSHRFADKASVRLYVGRRSRARMEIDQRPCAV